MRSKDMIDEEYESVCDYMASRHKTGKIGDKLPPNISTEVLETINADIEAFQRRIRDWAYMYAMEKVQACDKI
jgi:hypothetical protein